MNHQNQTGASCSIPFSLLAAFLSASVLSCSQFQIEQIKAEREIDYLRYGEKFPTAAPAQHSYAVHLESRDSVAKKTTESQKINSHIVRHPESATYALDAGGREASGLSIPTHVFDTDIFFGAVGTKNASSEDRKAIALNHWAIENATVITISMKSDLSFLNPSLIHDYRNLWKESNAIVFQAAGNDGDVHCSSSKQDPVLPQEYHYVGLADTYLQIGAGIIKDNGKIMIASYSDCAAVDFLALNPYAEGLKYPFVRKKDELEKSLDEKKSLKAFESTRANYQFDADNNVIKGLYGTSFTAPYAGGHVAGQHERHPELSEYDLVAATLIASRPIEQVEVKQDNASASPALFGIFRTVARDKPTSVTYRDNGAGLPFDQKRAGFGFLDFKTYATVVDAMAEWQKSNPALKTEEKIVTATTQSPKVHDTATVPQGYKAYPIPMNENMTTLRATLVLDLDPKSFPSYDVILRSPSGMDITLNPHYIPPERVGRDPVLVSTNGFLGNDTRGDWQLIVSEHVIPRKVDLTIAGTQKNGLIDKAINHFSALKKETSFQDESKKKPETINDPALLPKIQMFKP